MWSISQTRPGRFAGLMNEVERTRPSRPTERRLKSVRKFLFIGTVPDDEAKTKPILDMIERDGHALWIDHLHLPSGPSYARDAVASLRACRAMLVFCSAAAYDSAAVRREIAAAFQLQKPLVPVLLDGTTMPDTFRFYLDRWPAIRLDDPHWKLRLRSATEAIARGKRRWQASPPISADCAPVLVLS